MSWDRCPYLRLRGSASEVLPRPSPRHRCHASLQAELVDQVMQDAVCLTPDYERCPRLATRAFERAAVGKAPSGFRRVYPAEDELLADSLPVDVRTKREAEKRPLAEIKESNSKLLSARRGSKRRKAKGSARQTRPRTRRRATLTEKIVYMQAATILLAIVFVSLSFAYRSWITLAGGNDWIAGITWGRIALDLESSLAETIPDRAAMQAVPDSLVKMIQTMVPDSTPDHRAVASTASAYISQLAALRTATPAPITETTLPEIPSAQALAQVSGSIAQPPAPAALPSAYRAPATPTVLPTTTSVPAPSPTAMPEALLPELLPTRLVIPSIQLNTVVEPVGYKTVRQSGKTKFIWDTPPYAAGFHDMSAVPGRPGNTVINGHRDIYGSVFFRLDKVKIGDEILVFAGEQRYAYYVREIRVVPYTGASAAQQAEHIKLMGETPEDRLTLITCTPIVFATHRLYVIAAPQNVIQTEANTSSTP